MIQEYLLDSNILIYFSQDNEKIISLLRRLGREYFFISTVSSTEVLMGAKSDTELEELNDLLHQFAPLDLNTKIALEAVRLTKAHPKKLKFKDLIIAATAKTEGLMLITADKDFKKLKGLKVKLAQL